MIPQKVHSFHIPVMGIGFTIDTPLKVAPFGIDSVISIVDDIIIEQMREYYYNSLNLEYEPISNYAENYRARRITDYLNLINRLVDEKFQAVKNQAFEEGSDIYKYFEILSDDSPLKIKFQEMLDETDEAKKTLLQEELRDSMVCGAINVNIMTKVDTVNYDRKGNPLDEIYNDAMAGLRGYALSDLTNSSVVLSAGLNPKLFAYFEQFDDFFPDENGVLKKKVILKVSDYRSALIQGKMLAKRGIWVSEVTVESGLNCGGHAFATDGKLLGTILEEFKNNKQELVDELFAICNEAIDNSSRKPFDKIPEMKINVQGGIGTYEESKFLLEYYQLDSTGWGSPFLLVPEATNVDEETLQQLANAKKEDYYLSTASPLGVPLNNFRNSSAERLLKERIEKNRPGSPCKKKFLTFDNEFTEQSICTASRQYQNLKLKQLEETVTDPIEFEEASKKILEKECLCEGLAITSLLVNNAAKPKQLKAVSICPGPNLAYFSGTFTMEQMVDHIYGRLNVLNQLNREHMFVNELEMYVDHLKGEIDKSLTQFTKRQTRYFENFKSSLLEGVDYYKGIFDKMKSETEDYRKKSLKKLENWEKSIDKIQIPQLVETAQQ